MNKLPCKTCGSMNCKICIENETNVCDVGLDCICYFCDYSNRKVELNDASVKR